METTLIYFILITSFLVPMIQVLVSMNYFKRFAFEYLLNEPISWNSNQDRSALVFSVAFGLSSFYLARQIWQGATDDSWFLTTIYLLLIVIFSFFSIYYLIFIQKNKWSSINKQEIDSKKWRDFDVAKSLRVCEYFIETKKIKAETNKDNFHLIFSDRSTKTKEVWTGKYNGRLTYTTLILFYKVILKREYFTKENVRKEMQKNFLFEKKDTNTGEIIIGELDSGSFENAFDRINFDNLLGYQQEEFDKYSEFFK